MVREEHEDIVLGSGLQNSLGSLSFDCISLSLDDIHKDLWRNISPGIINFYSSVDVDSLLVEAWLVEDLAREGVPRVVGDIVEGKGNDILSREIPLSQGFVSIENIGLMSVVEPGVGPSDQNCVLVTCGDADQEDCKN